MESLAAAIWNMGMLWGVSLYMDWPGFGQMGTLGNER